MEHAQSWVVTSYFNPLGYRRRLANYRQFRRHLQAPLLTVELAHDGRFALDTTDADCLIQITGGDILWQKERLLNLAVEALPASCDAVAFLDCDVVFGRTDWLGAAASLLERYPLVQPFSEIHHLDKDQQPTNGNGHANRSVRGSLACLLSQGRIPVDAFRRAGGSFRYNYWSGAGWVARRETLAAHGLYDAGILGGGDKLMAAAGYGHHEDNGRAFGLDGRRLEHYRAWAEPFWQTIRGAVGYVEGSVFHLWHGEMRNRVYVRRFRALEQFDFDPATDIALTESGCWRWSSAKPELHRYLREFFAARQEDGSPEPASTPARRAGGPQP